VIVILIAPPDEKLVRRRTRRDPRPHFKPDRRNQLDALVGCPELQVPADHLARKVWALVGELDVSVSEARYSSLGRHGYAPRNLLAVWVYASLQGLHYASVLARALRTDAALRFLAGGYAVSVQTLRRFRQHNQTLFEAALQRTVTLAVARGLVREDELAVDSMRLRAHASGKAVHTVERSTKRVVELEQQLAQQPDEATRKGLEAKLARHREALRDCAEQQRSSVVRTNALAGVIKFPYGGVAPGHRLTVTGCGRKERLVLGVLVDTAPNDHGHLQPAVEQALAVLEGAGVPRGRLRLMGDAGYWDEAALVYAEAQRDTIDVLIAEQPQPVKPGCAGLFQHGDFLFGSDGRTVTCPAGRTMHGPRSHGKGVKRWDGVDCPTCPLRDRCCSPQTTHRRFTASPAFEQARTNMRARLSTPEGRAAYRARMATIEPIFSSVECDMAFRRASSRHEQTIRAEVLLKLLAHNIRRLLAAQATGSLSCIWVAVDEF
jgi:transposase